MRVAEISAAVADVDGDVRGVRERVNHGRVRKMVIDDERVVGTPENANGAA